ncbi:MAG: hypothetical protein ACREQC_12980, partial [Candidatus Binataceae bacterium]
VEELAVCLMLDGPERQNDPPAPKATRQTIGVVEQMFNSLLEVIASSSIALLERLSSGWTSAWPRSGIATTPPSYIMGSHTMGLRKIR